LTKYLVTAVLAVILLCSEVGAEGNYVEILLPKGVTIDLPKNWIVLNGNQRISLDSAVEGGLDLASMENINSSLPFAANYYSRDGRTAALTNIRFYPDLELTQKDALNATPEDVIELDKELRKALAKSAEAFGFEIVSWGGTEKNTINGLTVFTTEYHRKSLKSPGNLRVRLVRAFISDQSFTLTISYLVSQEQLLKFITDRIISSINVSRISSSKNDNINNNVTTNRERNFDKNAFRKGVA
jgi:hypothetical protein